MILRESTRKILAVAGCVLWAASSLMPMFGGAAKRAVRCRGRDFSGAFDDCFNDALPVLEVAAPFVAFFLLYPFARLVSSALAPPLEQRSSGWRLASQQSPGFWHPVLPIVMGVGCAWAIWRLSLYPLDRLTMPYKLFWGTFATWFAILALSCAREVQN